MKGKHIFIKRNINYIKKTTMFKSIIMCFAILNLFQGGLCVISYGLNNLSFYKLLISVFSNDIYLLLTFFLYFFNTVYIYYLFSNNQFYLLRNKTKVSSNNKIIENILLINTLIFILNIIMLILCILFISIINHNFKISFNNIYTIIYTIWYFARCYIWIQIFSLYIISISKYIFLKLMTIFNIIILVSTFFYASMPNNITSINDIGLSVYRFLLPLSYSSIPFEISISTLYILVFLLLLQIIEKLIKIIYNKKIIRYIKIFINVIRQDIYIIIKSQKWLIILYILILIMTTLWFYDGASIRLGIDNLTYILGISYQQGDDFLKLTIALINWLTYIYITYKIVLKNTQLKNENWFLRLKPSNLIILKLSSIIIVTLILKTTIYIILYIIFSFSTYLPISLLLNYYTKDLLFTINIELIAIICFFINYILPKYKLLSFILIIPTTIIILRKAIINQNIIFLLFIVFIETILLIYLFDKKGRLIFENIENGG